jgi:3-oxoacyl-[acyl-carrier-protein] synthase II
MTDDRSRIVATGFGVLSPLGNQVETFWSGLLAGRDGIDLVPAPDGTHYRAGVVSDFRLVDHLGEHVMRDGLGRTSELALAATAMALADAGLGVSDVEPDRVALLLGTTFGEAQTLEAIVRRCTTEGPATVDGRLAVRCPASTVAANVAAVLGLRGRVHVIPTACASGNQAIAHAAGLLRDGICDVALAGGVDALSYVGHQGFARIFAIAPDACRPFDRNRRGLLTGEGAGVIVLERAADARRRRARVYGEVLGWGLAADAHHMTNPHPDGRGAVQAIRTALARGGVGPEAIDYVSAHGTGTHANDRVETAVLKAVLGARASAVPVSAIKSMLGHTMGAASALQAIASLLAIARGVIPPTTNYETADPECDLDYVPNRSRPWRPAVVLSNAFGFGGNVAVLLVGRAREREATP